MNLSKAITMAVFALVLGTASANAQTTTSAKRQASDLWASAFSWLQTGNNLATLEQWPLAMASYSESLRQYKQIAVKLPDYEPNIIEFRIRRLGEMLAETQAQLVAADHDIMMLYHDTIEMIEEGKHLRFVVEDFAEAYRSLMEADGLLADLIAKRPDEFAHAMKSQSTRIKESLAWLEAQLGYENRQRTIRIASSSAYRYTTIVRGTTEFIGEEDLPTAPDEVEISAALFPSLLDPITPAP